jgi:hypothetical protein
VLFCVFFCLEFGIDLGVSTAKFTPARRKAGLGGLRLGKATPAGFCVWICLLPHGREPGNKPPPHEPPTSNMTTSNML